MYPDHHIAPDSKFMDAQLLDTESRELIEKELECKQRTSGGADIEMEYIELFEILFGADNGPWRARPLHGIYNLRQLQAINFSWWSGLVQPAASTNRHCLPQAVPCRVNFEGSALGTILEDICKMN